MDRRAKYQDRTFGALAELGLSTGELRGFTVEEATEMLRSLVMGWFFERYFRGGEQQGATNVVVATMRALVDRTPSASDQ